MKSNLKIAFLTSTDPHDKKSWSGTHYRMLNSLEQEFSEIIVLGPIHPNKILLKILYRINALNFKFFQKKYNVQHNILTSKYFANKFRKKLRKEKIDVIFAPCSTNEIALLDTQIPICLLADTSFSQLVDYYEGFSNLSKASLVESNFIERKALKKSSTLVFSSEWASEYAIDFYNVDKHRTFVVKFGANIDSEPLRIGVNKGLHEGVFKLLFIGVDWKRKGGDIAFDTFTALLMKGHEVTLTVCGCIPPVTHPKMEVIPFLNKNIKSDMQRFISLLERSYLLIVPTRADCTPIVFCEASAFGLPVITTNTGGVSSIIEDGINGYSLPYDAKAYDYANKINFLIENPPIYTNLSLMSHKKYEEELNWKVWGKKLKEILLITCNSDKDN